MPSPPPAAPRPRWAAEHEVPPDQAAALVTAHFPELSGATLRLLGVGWDNTVYAVTHEGRSWVFRFPRREVAVRLQRHELAVLPDLAGRLPLAVPDPQLRAAPTEAYPWPFWGAPLIPGRELAVAGLSDDERVPVAAAVGRFLRTLHDPVVAPAAAATLPVDPNRRSDARRWAGRARQRLGELAAAGLTVLDPALDRVLAAADRLDRPPRHPVLVHGDLHPRHVLVDADGVATGVIDWGDVCRADAAVDVSIAFSAFAGGARAAFFGAYGSVGADTELRARTLAVGLCATLAVYAHVEGQAALLAECRAGLTRAVGD